MSENILEVKGLTKDYGDFVLDKLTFTVPKGVIMGLIGENGAGKSTTINCILNEISKTDGNIEIFGKDYLSEEIEIKDKIGVVFDENHFPDIFTPNEIGTYMSGIYSKWERNTYDADSGDGTVYEYNYSRMNEGGCVMFCLEEAIHNTFRHNVSYDDLGGTISPASNPDARLEQNIFYVRDGVPFVRNHMDGGNYTESNDRIIPIEK